MPYHLVGVSALEHFFSMPLGPCTTLEVQAELHELARTFDSLSFPALPHWDAMVTQGEHRLLIRTTDAEVGATIPIRAARGDHHDSSSTWQESGNSRHHPLLAFRWDPQEYTFHDPHDVYPLLKEARHRLRAAHNVPGCADGTLPDCNPEPVAVDGLDPLDAAVITARFPLVPAEKLAPWVDDPALPPAFHQLLLIQVLTGTFARRGLEILRRTGYLETVIPELAIMNETEHSKEGHPEGNVWLHTMETLQYRKHHDLTTALALVLHDVGKPLAQPRGNRRFDKHADIGAELAGTILRRLAFSPSLIADVQWLIRFHMIPGALERLPDHRRDPIMASPLFPLLLEVYRCDLSSTFRGPENYYRACTIYRRFQKRQRGTLSVAG